MWTYAYDDAGRLTLRTDALGQKTRFTYDATSRVLTKTSRADTAQAQVTTYTYDEERALAYITLWEYDAGGRAPLAPTLPRVGRNSGQ